MYRKNVASQFIHFQGVDATTGGIKSGVTWTVRRCIDGTFAAGGGTVTEDGTTGWYKYAMAQADTNGNNLGFNFTGTGAVPQTVNAITTAADPTTATNFGLSALPTANPGAAGGLFIAGTNAAVTINGTAAAGATPATAALTLSGGAASTTGGGVSAAAIIATGGAGAASTNGAAAGATFTAGGVTTVSGNDGVVMTGTNAGNGLTLVHAGAGKDFNATTTPLTLAKTTNITGFNDITAAAAATGVWQDATAGDFTAASSIGKSLYTSGNAPGAASGLAIVGSNMGSVSSVTGAVGSVTAAVTVGTNNDKTGYSTTDFTAQLTEAYRANGAAPTPAQALMEILAHLGESSISGTTKTIKKLDHTTAAETFTLDSATTPASITRAT